MASRSITILSVLVSVVVAQSTNPFIPSDISASCSAFLTSLNNNSGFRACTNPFTAALAAFAPGTGATSPSVATISSALHDLCQSNAFDACPQSTVAAQLSSFYAACAPEMTSAPNKAVLTTYDSLYAMVPLRQAMCSKDDGGTYCALRISNTSTTGSSNYVNPDTSQKQSLLSQYLYSTPAGAFARRDVNSTAALVPNTTTYLNTNLLFFFLEPSLPSSTLCTTCTRNIMTPYITFESSIPYAPGLSRSLLLAGQVSLYANITSKCGSSFLSGAVQAAGGISGSLLSGAAPLAVGQELSAAVGAILGVAALVAASL